MASLTYLALRKMLGLIFPYGTGGRENLKSLVYTIARFKNKWLSRMFAKKVTNEKWPLDMPLVSVVIPCFNYGEFIEQAVDSVLAQTFQNFEIIVVDGGSTDHFTREVLQDLNKPKTSVYFREGRHLVGDNRNFGVSLAKGKYICCLDADDKLDPTYLEKALFFLEGYKYDVVHPSVQCYGDDTLIWYADPASFENMMHVGNAIATVGVFLKQAWQQVGGYKDWPIGEGHVPEDWDFWVRLMGHGFRFKNLREPLMLYRVHKGGLTGKNTTTLSEQRKIIFDANSDLLGSKYANIRARNNRSFYDVVNPALNLAVKKRKKRILLALPFMIIGGADTILLRIFDSLKTDYDISIVATLPALTEFGDNANKYAKITREIYHLNRFLSTDEEMRDFIHYLIESRDIDLIFIVGSELLYTMLPEIKIKHPNIKIIDQLFNEFGHITNNRKYASLINLNIAATNKIRDVLIDQYGERAEKVEVIIHGIDAQKEAESRSPLPWPLDDKLIISYFGRFSSEKAPDLFVEIIHKIVGMGGVNIRAVMTGNGPEYQKTLDLIENYELKEIIYTPGFVDSIRSYLAQTDILLVPSRIEGLPIIILEALSVGVPVIASDIGGISTVVIGGYDGYVCEAGNCDEFAARIKELADDQELLISMKKNALDFFKNNISEEKMNNAYNNAIAKVLQAEG